MLVYIALSFVIALFASARRETGAGSKTVAFWLRAL
jgi:hypothetical protein